MEKKEPIILIVMENFYYKDIGDGNIELTRYIGNSTDVVVPKYIKGKKVTKLKDNLFNPHFHKYQINSVSLPDGVTEIDYYAFFGCKELTKITIPTNVRVLGGAIFYNCPKLQTVEFKNISNIRVVSPYVFEGSDNISTFITQDNVPISLSKIILSYAIDHNNESMVEEKYTKKLDKKTFNYYIKRATETNNVGVMSKFITLYNKKFGNESGLSI